MAESDCVRWNARYTGGHGSSDSAPAPSLVALGSRLRAHHADARALDLACGTGRNAIFLAELGYRVDAWDISEVALGALQAELDRRAASGQSLAVVPRRVDLDGEADPAGGPIPPSAYDLVLDYYFLERALFPAMAAALRPAGWLLVETFLDAGRAREQVANPAYRLARGELPRAFDRLEIVEYVEEAEAGLARLLARRPR